PAAQAAFATAPNISVECGTTAPAGTALSYTNGETGVCLISGSTTGVVTGTYTGCGTVYTETWTFIDACSRTSTRSRTITAFDNIAPTVTAGSIAACYSSIAAAEAAAIAATTATDNCMVTLDYAVATTGTCTAFITVFVTDDCSNSSSVTYTTRIDNTGPTVTVGTISSCYPTVVAAEAAAISATSATDNCTGTLTYAASTSGTCSATITVTVTDPCGNSSSVTYNTRIDNAGPTVTAGSIASCHELVSSAEAAAIAATSASDNCTGTLTYSAVTSGDCFATVTVTVTDQCGNSNSVLYNTRIDKDPPIVTTGAIAACYATENAAEAAAIAATSATDNCPGTLTYSAETVGTCSAVITVAVSDQCGNSSYTVYTTRIDNTAPTVTAGTIEGCYANVAAGEAAAIAATLATDNCTGTLSYSAVTSGTCSAVTTVTVTDGCGNSASVIYNTRIDGAGPSMACLVNTVYLNTLGEYTLQPADVLNLSATTDNCGSVSVVSITPASFTCDDLGETVMVTVVAEDECGNQSTCIAQITVDQGSILPAEWSNDDVGTANGSATYASCASNGVFTVNSTGFSTSSTDKMHLVYQELCGNGEIIARVLTVSNAGWAGITLRETLDPGSKKVALKTQLTSIIRREIRNMTNGAASILNFNRPQHIWLRLVRDGSDFVGYTSINGTNWVFAFATTISMDGCIYAGIFAESINNSVTTTATFDNVQIIGDVDPLIQVPQTPVAASDLIPEVYPNPTTGEVNIDLRQYDNPLGMVRVFDAYGKLMRQYRLDGSPLHRIKIDGDDGVYLLSIEVEGMMPVSKRVVIAH
ncbi:MAG: T9SS type A sorting domain-containing protein, partial [Saprospiraceae bacterium]|nr:T9SS type A sorting domain-containing protein [Saprospiraceae bacterium]